MDGPSRSGEKRPASLVLWSLAVDLVYLVLLPFLVVGLLVASRGLTRPKLRRGLLAKLGRGLPQRAGEGPCLWIHAVSVGEVLTALPLVEALRRARPHREIILSTSTFTGLEVARKQAGDLTVIYFPLDLSSVVRRCFRRLKPSAVVLIELELWPNFLLVARRLGIPVLVANGRISARSAARYALGGRLTRRFFNLASAFGAQNEAYRQRFLGLGVEPSKVEVLGNLKHDRGPSSSAARGPEARSRLGWTAGETLVWVSGCTHPGEEAALLEVFTELKRAEPRLRLILAPRHVERLSDVELSSWRAPEPLLRWSAVRDSKGEGGIGPSGIVVVDTLGELEMFYAMADIVFVGGSLIPRGGHNFLEPARLGKAVLFGPHHENFQEEAQLLLAGNGALRVAGVEDLRLTVRRLLERVEERAALAGNALRISSGLQGAVHRHIEWLEGHLRLSLQQGS